MKAASVFRQLGAGFCADSKRDPLDFYATPLAAVNALSTFLEAEGVKLKDLTVIDSSVGAGHILSPLIPYAKKVIGFDVVDRGFPGTVIQDFLSLESLPRAEGERIAIVQNPPFYNALDFILKGLKMLQPGEILCSLQKIQFLESQERRKKIFDVCPPRFVCVFSRRIKCAIRGDFDAIGSSAMCYGWFIWVKPRDGAKPVTVVRWIN